MFRHIVLPATLLAVLAALLPWLFRHEGFDTALIVALLCGVAWTAIVITAVVRRGRSALWLLLEAPLALYWPIAFVDLIVHGGPT